MMENQKCSKPPTSYHPQSIYTHAYIIIDQHVLSIAQLGIDRS